MMPSVHIYSAWCRGSKRNDLVRVGASWLSASIINKSFDYLQEADACRYLLGKMLLVKGMRQLTGNGWCIDQLVFDAYKKPFCNNGTCFNITHSGDYVLCAISDTVGLGIDIEQIRDIEPDDFLHCFTAAEWQAIRNMTDPLAGFYRFWTRKEAVMKADGRGMYIPLQSFEVLQDHVALDHQVWSLLELPVDERHSAHLATSISLEGMSAVAWHLVAGHEWY